MACSGARVSRDLVGAPPARSSCRRTTSTACRRPGRRARAICADGAAIDQGGGEGAAALRDTLPLLRDRRRRRRGGHRHGRRRRADAPAGGALRVALDLCRQRRRAGPDPAARMLDEFRFREIGPATRLFGVVSSTAMHSFSPVMHNAAFAAAGIDAVYVPLPTTDFGLSRLPRRWASRAPASRFRSSSTRCERRRADRLTQAGRRREHAAKGRPGWEATNTDVAGFLAPLEAVFGRSLAGARASVLGAGGSARAWSRRCVSRGVRVTVYARRPRAGGDRWRIARRGRRRVAAGEGRGICW